MFSPSVELTEPTISPERTAQLALSLRNDSEVPLRFHRLDEVLVPDRPGIALRYGSKLPPPGPRHSEGRLGVGGAYRPPLSLEAGESQTYHYYAVDDPRCERPYETGTYRFTLILRRIGDETTTPVPVVQFVVRVTD
ncbi:hypothetical protein [Haloarchaeobius sp. DFWS5]|uniref:hypothetical protein n=1 Tax=Haloarchaeobius sp. DFWS5 TaxID=3446114 RepID=UPI003EB8A2D2